MTQSDPTAQLPQPGTPAQTDAAPGGKPRVQSELNEALSLCRDDWVPLEGAVGTLIPRRAEIHDAEERQVSDQVWNLMRAYGRGGMDALDELETGEGPREGQGRPDSQPEPGDRAKALLSAVDANNELHEAFKRAMHDLTCNAAVLNVPSLYDQARADEAVEALRSFHALAGDLIRAIERSPCLAPCERRAKCRIGPI